MAQDKHSGDTQGSGQTLVTHKHHQEASERANDRQYCTHKIHANCPESKLKENTKLKTSNVKMYVVIEQCPLVPSTSPPNKFQVDSKRKDTIFNKNQRRYNKVPTTKPGTLTTYTRCLAQLRLPFVLFLIRTSSILLVAPLSKCRHPG